MRIERLTNGEHFNAAEINKNMGERLVMHILMTYWDWSVECVDYTGVDLIAIDNSSKEKYAISIKTRDLTRESQTNTSFREKDFRYLCEFASDWTSMDRDEMIPLVAFVLITKAGHMSLLLVNAYDFDEMCKDKENTLITKASSTENYSFSVNEENLNRLFEDDRIASFDMSINHIKKCNLSRREKNTEINLKCENWKRQLGNFGEQYFAMKAISNGLRAFVINSIGADIILMDNRRKHKGYAVSVKTFSKAEEDSYSFEANNVQKLIKFSDKWGLEPIVALQFMIYKNTSIDGKEIKQYHRMYSMTMSLERMKIYDNGLFMPIFDNKNEYDELGVRVSWKFNNAIEVLKNDPEVCFEEIIFEDPIVIYDSQVLIDLEMANSEE